MARTHFWHYLQNEEGQPVENADVTVYLAGTTTPAYIYSQESGGTSNNTTPQLTTDSSGFFEFWIADATETDGYTGQKFKIAWTAPGIIDDGFVDYVEMPLSVAECDETDTDETKNKTVSNYLARQWTAKADIATFHVGPSGGDPEAFDDLLVYDAGNYVVNLTHNLERAYPLVMTYDVASGLSLDMYAKTVSASEVQVLLTVNVECMITIVG